MNDQEFRHTFALANAFKEGDLTVGGTTDDRIRAEARRILLATTVAEVRRHTLVNDGVTAALEQSRDRRFDHELDSFTIAQLKGALLESGAAAWVAAARGCTKRRPLGVGRKGRFPRAAGLSRAGPRGG